jgi:CheY-like chemotaxis protein
MPSRILVVEDNDPLREMLREMLGLRGFDVVVAATGIDALQMATLHVIDAVITDLDIPGMSGLELCRALNRRSERDIPVWLMTGSPHLTLAEALEAGACDVLRKPFSLEQACGRVKRALEMRSLEPTPVDAAMAIPAV